jgi:hypothetical protein
MSKVPLPKGARRIAHAPCKMAVVDSLTGKVIHAAYGHKDFVHAEGQKVLAKLDEARVRAGDFGLDYSEYCDECSDYHSPEADC